MSFAPPRYALPQQHVVAESPRRGRRGPRPKRAHPGPAPAAHPPPRRPTPTRRPLWEPPGAGEGGVASEAGTAFRELYLQSCREQKVEPHAPVLGELHRGECAADMDGVDDKGWGALCCALRRLKPFTLPRLRLAVGQGRADPAAPPAARRVRARSARCKGPLDPSTVLKLAKALEPLCSSTQLQQLEVVGIWLPRPACSHLAQGLRRASGLRQLSLKDSRMADAGFICLPPALRELPLLETLCLAGCQLSDRSAAGLASIIRGHQARRDREAWQAGLRDGGRPGCSRALHGLCHLDLADNYLGAGACRELCQVLHHDCYLRTLHLQRNRVPAAGARYLERLLRVNLTLEFVDLGGNEGAAALTASPAEGPGLRPLFESHGLGSCCFIRRDGPRLTDSSVADGAPAAPPEDPGQQLGASATPAAWSGGSEDAAWEAAPAPGPAVPNGGTPQWAPPEAEQQHCLAQLRGMLASRFGSLESAIQRMDIPVDGGGVCAVRDLAAGLAQIRESKWACFLLRTFEEFARVTLFQPAPPDGSPCSPPQPPPDPPPSPCSNRLRVLFEMAADGSGGDQASGEALAAALCRNSEWLQAAAGPRADMDQLLRDYVLQQLVPRLPGAPGPPQPNGQEGRYVLAWVPEQQLGAEQQLRMGPDQPPAPPDSPAGPPRQGPHCANGGIPAAAPGEQQSPQGRQRGRSKRRPSSPLLPLGADTAGVEELSERIEDVHRQQLQHYAELRERLERHEDGEAPENMLNSLQRMVQAQLRAAEQQRCTAEHQKSLRELERAIAAQIQRCRAALTREDEDGARRRAVAAAAAEGGEPFRPRHAPPLPPSAGRPPALSAAARDAQLMAEADLEAHRIGIEARAQLQLHRGGGELHDDRSWVASIRHRVSEVPTAQG
eukprot:TRINITY_DN28688_c0_g2_i5.p1 TRINITY_DN28688_c0_g2~~TRINITY_DN28688_c0_g2_i5.p1  ORF type:complete len:896 (+),score=287.84 TRINITY_DN28688_c0_g2_i5:120-2807(+)